MSQRKAALPFILITVLIDMLGIGLIIPVLPKLVATLHGGDLSSASYIFGWFIASYALMQFVFSPILGNLSDAYGRRTVLLLSLLGAGLDYLLMAFAPSLGWLFVGRVIAGITGANITAANAYIADISTIETRARNFGMIGMCFGVGFVVGPAIGGLLGAYGLRVPFMATAGLTLLNAVYGFFVLPESLAPENRRPFRWKTANAFATLESLRRYPAVLGMTLVLLLERLGHDTLPSTWVLFTTYRFHWSEWANGMSLAMVGIVFVIVQGALTGPLVQKLGERKALLIALLVSSLSFLGYSLATSGWMMFAVIAFSGLGGIGGPAMQTLITKRVSASEHGAVQGVISSVQSAAAIFGPLLATNLFGFFTSSSAPVIFPGAAFLVAALLDLAAGFLTFRVAE